MQINHAFWGRRHAIFISVVLAGASGCSFPVSSAPSVPIKGRSHPINVEDICRSHGSNEGGIIYPGLQRSQVHEILAGLNWKEFQKDNELRFDHSDCFGTFEKVQWYCYLADYHGPHGFGLYRMRTTYSIWVYYDDHDIVNACQMGLAIVDP